jgi:dephospho-CoA kinase
MAVVAICGRIGSGKTTLSKDLAATLGCPRASFGDYVRSIVQQRGLELTRENLQVVGTELLDGDPSAFCSSVLSNCGCKTGQDLIVDGLRHLRTIPIIENLIAPSPMIILHVWVPEEIRLRRLIERGEGDAANIARIESHSSEQELDSIVRLAGLHLRGDGAREENVAEVRAWLAKH